MVNGLVQMSFLYFHPKWTECHQQARPCMTHRRFRDKSDPSWPSRSGRCCSHLGARPGVYPQSPGDGRGCLGPESVVCQAFWEWNCQMTPLCLWPDLVFVGRRGRGKARTLWSEVVSGLGEVSVEVIELGGHAVDRGLDTGAGVGKELEGECGAHASAISIPWPGMCRITTQVPLWLQAFISLPVPGCVHPRSRCGDRWSEGNIL